MLLIDCWSNYFSAGELIGPPGPGYNVPLNPFFAGPGNGYFSQLIPPERIFPDDTFPVVWATKKNHLLQICFAIFISQLS